MAIEGVAIGTAVVTITITDTKGTGDTEDDTTETVTYDVTVLGFGIKSLAVKGDTDNVVSAGPQVTVVATVRSAVTDSDVRLTVPTTGLSIQNRNTDGALQDGTTQQQTQSVATAGTQMLEFTVNTAGAPAGDYTLTFTADNDGNFATTSSNPIAEPDGGDADDAAKATRLENSKQEIDTLTLTIGDPGTGLASATLSLGNSANDLPFTDKDETVAESGSDVAKATGDADGKINLVVEVFDSNGGKSNSSAVDQIIVIAPDGKIEATRTNTADTPVRVTESGDSSLTLDEDGTDPPDVGQRTVVTVSKEDQKPGQVTVYAIVSGPGGAARTDDITLTFSGPAASLSIADATESLLSVNTLGDDPDTDDKVETDFVIKDTIKLLVTAEDEGGNSAVPPTGGVSIVITDPDGKRQGASVIARSQPTRSTTDGKYYITLTGTGSAAKPLASGTWSLTAKSGKLEAEAAFAVAGAPADVAVSASSTSSDTIGDVIVVTASVTDKDGNTVSDGTSVMFDVSENTGLSAIGTGHSGKATKNGSASVKYAVTGAGSSVVSAEAGDATGVVVIVSTAGTTDDDAADEEASVACLSNLNGFATWSCSVESSASEIFGLVS
ncbi:MAG: hypothetical protein OXC29_21005, partial [Rhodococcus sp.]|nr:hypothetical protein [Rhodococcus sp. (in: high G+C Gram-positive bacteria)]